MGTEISEDNFKAYFQAKGMGDYTALDDIFTSEDDDPRGKNYKNALLISMTGLPAVSDSKTYWRNNEIYQFELYHPQKLAIKRIMKLLQIYPPLNGYSQSFEDVAPFNWTYVNAARSSEQASLGTYSIKPDTNLGTPAWAYYQISQPWQISIDVMAGNAGAYIPFYQSGPPGALTLFFNLNTTTNKILFNAYELASSFSLLTWYNLEMKNIDWTAKTADIYLDGVLKVTGASWTGSAPNWLTLQCADASAYCYFDNLIINGGQLDNYEKIPDFPNPAYLGKRHNGMHKWRILMEIQKTEEVLFE